MYSGFMVEIKESCYRLRGRLAECGTRLARYVNTSVEDFRAREPDLAFASGYGLCIGGLFLGLETLSLASLGSPWAIGTGVGTLVTADVAYKLLDNLGMPFARGAFE